ncbi:hypothetical protein EC951288_3738B, partial [Escherichia coli 95.1288]
LQMLLLLPVYNTP